MSDSFTITSRSIAKNFIQSILFVDDKVHNPDQGDHPFDVKLVIEQSVTRGLIAAAFAPKHHDDISTIVEVGRKADVIVLDWRMDFPDNTDQGLDDDEAEDVADSRGDFAVNAIKNLIIKTECGETVDQLKLIFIYTGETGLQAISSRLNTEFADFTKLDEFTFSCGGIRISIWAKEILSSSFRHIPENKKRLRTYTQLLDEMPIEYATVSSGLLSNTCLAALASLRNNTYKLLARFTPSLDPAFVAHRAMLHCPDDAGELLKETICGELNSILTDEDIAKQVSSTIIDEWMSSRNFIDNKIKVKKGNDTTPPTTITIDNARRKLWQRNGYIALLTREQNTEREPLLNVKEINKCERDELKKHAVASFTPQNFNSDNFNEEFSILTHHKRNYLSTANSPSLSLGVMVKENDRYLLCIQQRCDSVRIPDGEKRKFLFLPMKKNNQNFDVLFNNGGRGYVKLSTCYKECHALEIIEFVALERSGIVQAQKEEGVFNFTGGSDNQIKYQWILDLKEAHAQRIANNFAAQLARVGIDESEWLRRT
ncbi:hypothetical protein HN803_00070 [candidate division WWE3 bacterium]|nr:hypothetical protein [candidate division WWE3 bacterium]